MVRRMGGYSEEIVNLRILKVRMTHFQSFRFRDGSSVVMVEQEGAFGGKERSSLASHRRRHASPAVEAPFPASSQYPLRESQMWKREDYQNQQAEEDNTVMHRHVGFIGSATRLWFRRLRPESLQMGIH